ncbi:mechanosensitive ion channel family protein [Sphingomonas faeni]|uniref:mechanosensitive ion channel family protein n=1 Tax=Sphingomonas faeni TaxID=185950 RepID=UPI0033640036
MVLLIALFLATQPLGLAGATGPLGDMLQVFGTAIPRIIGAALIFFLGYVLAKVAKKAVEASSRTAISSASRHRSARLRRPIRRCCRVRSMASFSR